MGKTYAIANQKGGVGKTTTTANLGIGLARKGKKVLVVDDDSQASLTICLGCQKPNELPLTLAEAMTGVIRETSLPKVGSFVHHAEGIDLLPANMNLAGMELALVNEMSRETILRYYLDSVKHQYDYILIDTPPSLGMLTINSLAAADAILIPVQTEYLAAKGLEQLLKTIAQVRRQINPGLDIAGILLTMVDERTIDTREIIGALETTYGANLPIVGKIPRSIRAAEIAKMGTSIFRYDPDGKVAAAYESLSEKVLKKHRAPVLGMEVSASV